MEVIMRITKHALTRIQRGDKQGLRTVLSTSEVTERIVSPTAIKIGGETFYWSEADGYCLVAITAKRGKVLITTYPADRDFSPWMAMVCKYRYFQHKVFEDVSTTSYDPHKAIMISLSIYDGRTGLDGVKDLDVKHCVWYDFEKCDSPMFWSEDFHQMLADFITQYLNENEVSKKRREQLRIRLHGNGWACLVPIETPFELLELANPLQ
jgi:hypothetical protein